MGKIKINVHPLSVNKCWQGRRFKTKDYLNYEEEVLYLIGRNEMITGYVGVEYDFYIKNFKLSDVGNLEKPLTDIIVKAGLIEDDRFIITMKLTKHKIAKYIKEYIVIRIYHYNNVDGLV